MPKDLKKRGRRAEQQRRQAEIHEDRPSKRIKTDHQREDLFNVNGDAGDDFISFGQDHNIEEQADGTTTFYGLLTEDEQEYYANVNTKISTNDFKNDLERANFIDAVHRETAGKEIKVASSQSCSRYLEKIIKLSTTKQLRQLFLAFLQDIEYLVQHRFGSHCIEALFIEASRYVEVKSEDVEQGSTSFQSLFLEATKKLRGNCGFFITERFASHTIRLLLLILSGQPLEDNAAKDIVTSRKKENVEIQQEQETKSAEARKVPDSFKNAWQDFVQSAVAGFDATYIRALATSPIGSPVLQLFLRLELSQSHDKDDKSQGVLQKLVPDQNFEPESESSKFISALVYDTSGAYLVQILVRHLPGKAFKRMYKGLFRERIGKLAKNDIASYVAVSVLERIGKEDLAHARQAIILEMPGLIERHRLAVIKTLVERCGVRNVELDPVKEALFENYGRDPESFLWKMLHLDICSVDTQDESEEKIFEGSSAILQSSILAQSILLVESLSNTLQDGLCAQTAPVLHQMAKIPSLSRVVQTALTSDKSSIKFLRQFVPKFYDMTSDLATHPSGSHVVDALWHGTKGLHFMKQRIATLLQNNETKLRESVYGRRVWKNWAMDVYQRRPSEWHALAKGLETGERESTNVESRKSGIELARERYMQRRSRNVPLSKGIVVDGGS